MTTTEQYYKDRLVEATKLVKLFNKKHKKSVVYLKLRDNDSGSFEVHMKATDKFLEPKYYDEGSAYIYLSDALYEEVQKLAGDRKVEWNNTRSTGYLQHTK